MFSSRFIRLGSTVQVPRSGHRRFGPYSPTYGTSIVHCEPAPVILGLLRPRSKTPGTSANPAPRRSEPMSNEQVSPSEELLDNIDRGRFELYRSGELCGWLFYSHLKPNRYALQHTEVDASHQHQGVGAAMVRRVLDEIRSRQGTITPICPFVVDFLSRTTAYTDLIDRRHP